MTGTLDQIRTVLNPPVADLSRTFGVPRQSVYNWIRGDLPTDENAGKLAALAEAADVLEGAGIEVTTRHLRRKLRKGQSLLEICAAGGDGREAAQILVAKSQKEAEQQAWLEARYAGHDKRRTSADFRLPASDVME